MNDQEQKEFKILLSDFIEDRLDESRWQQFDELLKTHRQARNWYRQALSMEMDLEDRFQVFSNQNPIVQVASKKRVGGFRLDWKVIIAALILLALIPFFLIEVTLPARKSPLPAYVTSESYAVITEVKDIFKDLSDQKINLYREVGREKIKFISGHIRLEYFNGAIVELEGPCEYYLQSEERSYLKRGQLSAKLTPDSEDFKIFSPGVSMVELGTEFALKVDSDEMTQISVFEGDAEVSLLNDRGESVHSERVPRQQSYVLNPKLQTIAAQVPAFELSRIETKERVSLPFKEKYLEVCLLDQPVYQWGTSAMEMVGWKSHGLHQMKLNALPQEANSEGKTWLSMNAIEYFNEAEFSIEFWFNASAIHQGALLSLLRAEPSHTFDDWSKMAPNHLVFLEACAEAKDTMHSGGRLRYLLRSPSGNTGGYNLFSQVNYIPGKWHHVVATCAKDLIELYMDGQLQSFTKLEKQVSQDHYFLYLGALDPVRQNQRRFRGGIEAVSVYSKRLSVQQVQQHFLAQFSGS